MKSKTVVGVLLGILATLLDSFNLVPGLPSWLMQAVQFASGALVIFGIVDAAEQEQKSLKDKISGFVTKYPAVGFGIEILAHALENLEQLNVPGELLVIAKVLGAAMIVLGIRDSAIRGRENLTPSPRKQIAQG